MLIYLGLFFIIPDKFRSGKYLPITLSVGILGACLGLYGIWKTKQVPENFGAGVGEACGPSGVICGSDDTSGAPSQLYQVTIPATSQAAGLAICKRYGGVLASVAQVTDAYNNGASMQMWAWVSDNPNFQAFPVRNNSLTGNYFSGSIIVGNTGPNCWGPKPPPSTPSIRPWTDRANTVNGVTYAAKDWSRKDSGGTPLPTMRSSATLDYCLINMRTLPKGTVDQSVVFNIFGRYVRVLASLTNGDAWFGMSQLMVYDANGTNIARSKSVTASSVYPGVLQASSVVDGTATPRTWPNVWHTNGGGNTEFFQVDLGSVQMITSVRIINRSDCCTSTLGPFDRITGMRIVIFNDPDLEVPTAGSCIPTPTPVYPAGATAAEQVKLRTIIMGAMDGQKALNVLRGIQSSTSAPLTNYGLTDSQAAAAYNKLFMENLNFRRAGWQFSASWTPGTNTLTVTGGVPPIVNMTVKTAKGIAVGARVTAVSGNTVTLDRNTDTATGTAVGRRLENQPVTMNGDMNDASYFSNGNTIRNMQTMASITYDRAGTLANYMKWNKANISVAVLDSAGNPVLNSAGNPTMSSVTDNGETAATSIIMSVTKVEAIDPVAVDSSATKATTTSPDGVAGYNVPAPPNTTNWSETALNKIPQQTAAINLGNQAPIVVNPDTTDAQIAAQTTGAFRTGTSTISQAVMDGGATSTASSAGYTAPSQSESGVAGTSGGAVKEVFFIGRQNGYTFATREEANQACVDAGADRLATDAELRASQQAGAQWCACAWLQDTNSKKYPMNENGLPGCGGVGVNDCGDMNGWTGGRAGANCFGFKPSANDGHVLTTTSSAVTQTLTINRSGRYVRLRPSRTNSVGWMFFSQIVVKNKSGVNISQGKPTYATSFLECCGGSPPASVVVDGHIGPRSWGAAAGGLWHSGRQIVVNSTDPNNPNYDEEYFEIDLGSVQEISTIDYYGRPECCHEFNSGVRIEIAKSPRPRPFSNKTKSGSWNQNSKIDTSACPAGRTKISCNGVETCLTPGTACARSCPAGTSWNAEKQMCRN